MKIAIYGYGNLGRGVELAAHQNPDAELVGIFTRRPPEVIAPVYNTPVYSSRDVLSFKDRIDVLIICGGSATDLPEVTPTLARDFNVVDSYDNHLKISDHFAATDAAAREGGTLAVISAGWDPGIFSVMRVLFDSILPNGTTHTFWGRGVSQGHSDAIRRIDGVVDARQYTVPIPEAVSAARSGDSRLTSCESHRRECFVAVSDGADRERIAHTIKTMPGYFYGYDTTVHFVTKEDLVRDHSAMPHAGRIIRSGRTGEILEHNHTLELSLNLDSNPEFTGAALICVARAVNKMAKQGETGCKTMLDIPPSCYSPLSAEDLVRTI